MKPSEIDRDNPPIAQAGHIALIVPDFARGDTHRRDMGVYEYRGDDGWANRPDAVNHRRWS